MSRLTLPSLLFALGPWLGCSETCPTPDSINEERWTVFVRPVNYEIENEEAFPADTSPANGTHALNIAWAGSEPDGPVVVSIDGQAFDGRGRWDEVECGNFSVGFSGLYEWEGDQHAFSAAAILTTWEGHIDGFLDWQETWQSAEGAVGSYTADAQLESVGR